MIKEFTDWDGQIEKLKEHGCYKFSSIEQAKETLKQVNYYRLTGYFLPFRDNGTQKYDSSKVSFDKIYQIYQFDAQLRLLLLEYLEYVEQYFKTQTAYFHSEKYGGLGYESKENFNKWHNHEKFLEKLDDELKYHKSSLIYKHHKEKYEEKLPLWVAIEFFTFGMISRFYSDIPSEIQRSIAKNLRMKVVQVRTYIEVVSVLRNYCAHFNRLYYSIFSIIPGQLPTFMNENRKIKNRLLPQIYALKCLYYDKEKWDRDFIPRLEKLFKDYENDIHLHHIGFVPEWKDVLLNKFTKKSEKDFDLTKDTL